MDDKDVYGEVMKAFTHNLNLFMLDVHVIGSYFVRHFYYRIKG